MQRVPKAIIYTRVSTGKQVEEGTSLEVQEAACLRKAQELGAQVVDIIPDEGVSGAFYLSRPGIQKALSMLEAGEANILITMKLDRTGRDVDIVRLIQKRVTDAGARLVFADGMNFENNATGKLMMTQLAGFAEYERELIRERCMSGRRKRAEQGQQPSRTQSPFGYHIVTKQDVLRGEYTADQIGRYVIVPEEAPIARELFTRYAQGQSLRSLTLWLKTSGVATRRSGKNWHPSTVKYLLSNPVYKGAPIFGRFHWRTDESRVTQGLNPVFQRRALEDNWVRLQCEPLVTEAIWNTVQERLAENQATQSGPTKRRHMLSGLMVCAVCNRRMRSLPTRKGGLYYQCPEGSPGKGYSGLLCVNKTHRAASVEALILRDIRFLSRQPERFASALRTFHKRQEIGRGPEQEICRLQQTLSELDTQEEATARAQVDALAKGRSIEVYERLLADIDRKRKQTQTRLSALMAERPQRPLMDFDTDAERIAEVLRRVDDVLTDSEPTPVEKNQVLSTLIKAIRPEGDGYSLELRSVSDSAQGLLSVQMISIHCPPGASR